MNLYSKLEKIAKQTTEAFETENYNLNTFEQMAFEYPHLHNIPIELKEQTPLANFEKQIEEVMTESGFEYKLELVALPSTCDGGCYEPYYHLCWYNNGIHTATFHFETLY